MGAKRNVDMSVSQDTLAESKSSKDESKKTAESKSKQTVKKAPKKLRTRSKKYQLKRRQVDRTRAYDPFAAIELVKKLSYSNFDGAIEASGTVKEVGNQGVVTFPHNTGRKVKVVIVDDKVLSQIEAGKIDDIDVLLSTPEYMPKLAKHAPLLGPKGLMPNPKQGTLTANPEAKQKELEAGATTIKTQRKQPVFHLSIGKTSMDTKQLVENLQALLEVLKKKLIKLSISATMSPGLRIDLSQFKSSPKA